MQNRKDKTMSQNEKLEEMINQFKADSSKENLDQLIKTMEKSTLYIPATLPPDTDPALIKQIAESNGEEQQLPEGVSPRPAILENKEGKKFLPLFTTEEQAVKNNQTHPLILGLPFSTCMDLVANEKEIAGIVLNAFDQNVALNTNVTRNDESPKKEVKVTEAQLHILLRQQVEANVLPKTFFENGKDFVEAFKTEAGRLMNDIYEQIYPEQVQNPYTEEEFDLMALNIRDDLTILQLRMPTQKMGPGTCPMVLITWNPQEESIRYFGIVKSNPGEKDRILEALADGTKKDLGEAPAEGSELQYIIDLHTD